MSTERRYLWIAILVVTVVVLALFALPTLREELAPEPRGALVAVEVGGRGVAEVGAIRLASGDRFTLHAVLVAEDRRGRAFYYTRAPALRIDGRDIAPERLRAWDRPGEIAVLWFTVEGYRPFVRLEDMEDLETFRFEESFRPEWGRGWSVTGSLTPHNTSLARGFESGEEAPFGTMRYHVRIEKYFRRGDPAPIARYRSPGADVLPADPGSPEASVPALVEATLPGGLDRISAVFGLPQLEPLAASAPGLRAELRKWYEASLGFSRLLVLGGLLADRGLRWTDLEWQPVDLAEQPSWGVIGPGDFLRSGERLVVLWADRGAEGRLDYDDVCFDLAESAAARRLGEIFTGGGVLDWADVNGADVNGADVSGADRDATPGTTGDG